MKAKLIWNEGIAREIRDGKKTFLVVAPQLYDAVELLDGTNHSLDAIYTVEDDADCDHSCVGVTGGGGDQWLVANNTLANWLTKEISATKPEPESTGGGGSGFSGNHLQKFGIAAVAAALLGGAYMSV